VSCNVSGLFVYPIKGCGGVSVQSASVVSRGLAHDRRYMLVDPGGAFITQREEPSLARVQMAIAGDVLEASSSEGVCTMPLAPVSGQEMSVTVWDDTVTAWTQDPAVDAYFSAYLRRPVRLVYMPNSTHRVVDPKYAGPTDITSFSDGFPLLVISEASLAELNERLAVPVPMNRFRPNVVLGGATPFQEDEHSAFEAGGLAFRIVKACSRCVVVTTDQATGEVGKEPLATLATYRKQGNKVMFGQNVLVQREGSLHVGDPVTWGARVTLGPAGSAS